MAKSGEIEIWHNPRCSTSRNTLRLLEDRGLTPRVTLYLEMPPTRARLKEVLKMLGVDPGGLIRKKESLYRELGLGQPDRTADQLLDAMAANPILIERPVVIRGGRAAIGRPPEKVLDVLGR